jgi:hypothetical protein
METNMTTPPASTASENNRGYWRRVLRPLFWWLLLVLVLFGYHQHQLAMERTRINFSVFMQSNDVGSASSGKLDGQPVSIGQKISLGQHTLTLTNPKAESFTTNFFGWYGGRDFGQIDFIRAMGTLKVTATPPAQTITITGPEFSQTLTNSVGTMLTVPADTYEVRAQYPHWSQVQKPAVLDRQSASCIFAPQYGSLHLTCNREGSTYQLRQMDGQEVDSGNLPATITDLPADNYQMTVTYHQRQIQRSLFLRAHLVNEVPVDFALGTAHFESVPDFVSVETMDGAYLGQTPLDVLDLPAQPTQFRLTKPGFESVVVRLNIAADEKTTCHTNLIGINYQPSMQSARQYLAAANYQNAGQAIEEALAAKPGDENALALQNEINGHLAAERQRQEQLKRPRLVFDTLCNRYIDAQLFQEYIFKTSQPAKTVSAAIGEALQNTPNVFELERSQMTQPDTYETVARQSFSLGILGGYDRLCLLVVGQTKADETEILVKVLEYKVEHTLQLNNVFNGRDEKKFIPLSPARMQMNDFLQGRMQDGVQFVLRKIKPVIGQP